MSQEWDIDDILASLDELLQEDDKPKEQPKPVMKPRVVSAVVQPKEQCVSDPVASMEGDSKSQEQVAVIGKDEAEMPASSIPREPVLLPPHPIDVDVPDADFRQEPDVEPEAPVIVPRVLLTKDMLVDTEQKVESGFDSLSAAMDDEDDMPTQDDAATVASEDAFSMHLNAQQTAQMLELVAMDVSYQVNHLLPDMIRNSLKTHVQLMQQSKNDTK